ncbi:MASE1 domain-containing protein [Puniceicoccus vermicola]|uniref:histidine kinase n=1 Tax=Puniceicoccus vermicola TaxID=388746 RepID=A0A7X1E3U1_9BACT|nr:MASE1 domain-containing protein [Puniceicoccus vermicola]MBC2601324.1 MASE1 domain-containing protein [Puniceicoccus vermicola]
MKLIGLTGLYFLSGQIGWLFPDAFYTITPLWLPGGVGLVFLYFLGYRYFPAIWIGLFVLNLFHGNMGHGFAALTATGTTLATLTAVVLLRNRDFHSSLNRVRDLFPLIYSVIILSSLSALTGALGVFNFTDSDELVFFEVFSTWWVGEAIGGLIIGSLGFVWWGNPQFGRQRRLELASLIVGVIGISVLCFYNDNADPVERFQFSFIVFPSLVWAALRFGPHGTTLVTLLITVIALLGTVQDYGLFSFASPSQRLFLLQSYLAVISLTGLVLSSSSTEQSENEEALRIANDSLEDSVRSFSETAREARKANQKKSEFLALMSHELRNPLNGVVGFTSLLMNTDLTRAQRDHIRMIHSSGETLLGMIDEILDFNRIETNRPELDETPFSMRRLVGEVADTFRFHSDRKSVALELDYPENLSDFVIGDHQRIRQVLNNLVGNAVKFTDEGSVVIRVSEEKIPGKDGSLKMKIAVVDTGIGIEKEEADRLFAPFSQANQTIAGRFGGTGLGLVISKNLSDVLGASITLESEPGEGSTFFFTVPLIETSSSEVLAKEEQEHSEYPMERFPSLPAQRILIAEDNSTNQRVVQQLLDRLGHASRVARDGREALDLLKKERFDVVLLDIRMPGIDGYAVARAVREGKCGLDLRSLPIVAVTAHAMAEDKEKTREAGMNGHLTKPFDLEKLAKVLAEVVGSSEESKSA